MNKDYFANFLSSVSLALALWAAAWVWDADRKIVLLQERTRTTPEAIKLLTTMDKRLMLMENYIMEDKRVKQLKEEAKLRRGIP